MLTALAQHPDGLTKAQVLLHTSYRSSGPVSKAFADLTREGWVEPDSRNGLRITRSGVAALGDYESLPLGTALRAYLLEGSKLSTMEKALLRAICDAYPSPLAKGEVLTRVGYASSGPVSKAFARLVRYGYVASAGRSELRASDDLFKRGGPCDVWPQSGQTDRKFCVDSTWL
jgi:DNA-binding transcriptional regulator YhcF (GntR family)